jgi:hypothetical protein
MAVKKYIYEGRDLFEILGKKSDAENEEFINKCLIEGRKTVLRNQKDQRHTQKIIHFNKVIKALPEKKTG